MTEGTLTLLVTMDRHASPSAIHLLTLLKTDVHVTERLGDADTGSKAACVSVLPPGGLDGRLASLTLQSMDRITTGQGTGPWQLSKLCDITYLLVKFYLLLMCGLTFLKRISPQ